MVGGRREDDIPLLVFLVGALRLDGLCSGKGGSPVGGHGEGRRTKRGQGRGVGWCSGGKSVGWGGSESGRRKPGRSPPTVKEAGGGRPRTTGDSS